MEARVSVGTGFVAAMPKGLAMLCLLTCSIAAFAQSGEPIIENEHLTVWDTSAPLSPSSHDFVAVSLSQKGTARFGNQGEIPGKTGSRTIVIELKDLPVTPLANETGYPL